MVQVQLSANVHCHSNRCGIVSGPSKEQRNQVKGKKNVVFRLGSSNVTNFSPHHESKGPPTRATLTCTSINLPLLVCHSTTSTYHSGALSPTRLILPRYASHLTSHPAESKKSSPASTRQDEQSTYSGSVRESKKRNYTHPIQP